MERDAGRSQGRFVIDCGGIWECRGTHFESFVGALGQLLGCVFCVCFFAAPFWDFGLSLGPDVAKRAVFGAHFGGILGVV